MPSMRMLLAADPALPLETREAIDQGSDAARRHLVAFGLDECEAAELLDESPPPGLTCD